MPKSDVFSTRLKSNLDRKLSITNNPMMPQMLKPVLLFLFCFALMSCNTFPNIQSHLPWAENYSDQECVQKAIRSVPDVLLLKTEEIRPEHSCTKSDCIKKMTRFKYSLSYDKQLQSRLDAFVEIIENASSEKSISNNIKGPSQGKLLRSDRMVLEYKFLEINQAIEKQCK